MRYREIIETPYLQQTLKQIGSGQKTGAPVPSNKLPKGPIKTSQTKGPIKKTNQQANQQLLKPGATIPMPSGPNKEVNYKVDQVQGDEVTMKTDKVTPQSPQSIKVNKKDLDPVITNLQRRQKATT